jgi:hypothetical protein
MMRWGVEGLPSERSERAEGEEGEREGGGKTMRGIEGRLEGAFCVAVLSPAVEEGEGSGAEEGTEEEEGRGGEEAILLFVLLLLLFSVPEEEEGGEMEEEGAGTVGVVEEEEEEEEEEEGGEGMRREEDGRFLSPTIDIFLMTTKSVMSGLCAGGGGFLLRLMFLLAVDASNHSPKNECKR